MGFATRARILICSIVLVSSYPASAGLNGCLQSLRALFRTSATTSPTVKPAVAFGTQVVQDLRKPMERLIQKMGYRDYAGYQAELFRHRQALKKGFEALRDENVDFAIHAPAEYREKIAKEGFRHSFETGNSYGDHVDYVRKRDAVEANFAQVPIRKYKRLPPELKPRYGLLRPKADSGVRPFLADGYGTDVWIVRKDAVQGRLTFTLGDSLNQTAHHMMKMAVSHFTRTDPRIRASSWYRDIFIPWEMRDLAIPVIDRGIKRSNTLEVPPFFESVAKRREYRDSMQMGGSFQQEFERAVDSSPLVSELPVKPYVFESEGNAADYLELQFWHPLDSPEYFEKLIVREEAPSPAVLRQLQLRGVQVLDGRDPAKAPVPFD